MKVHEHSFCPECGQALEGSEYLCPSCAFKLAEPPVEETPPPPPVNESVPPPIGEIVPPIPPINEEVPPVPPVENPEPPKMEEPVPPVVEPKVEEPVPPVQEPKQEEPMMPPPPQGIFNQTTPPMAMPPKKKSKLWLWIVLIVVGFLLIATAVGAFLIYNGTIPKKSVDFLPKQVLEMLTPQKINNGPVNNAPSQVYYLAYSFALLEETNEKVIIISSVMDPGSVSQSNEFGAKSSFNDYAKINYPDDYFLFKDVKVKKYTSREDAVNDRESIKKDYKSKGYTLRLMEVVYSIK